MKREGGRRRGKGGTRTGEWKPSHENPIEPSLLMRISPF